MEFRSKNSGIIGNKQAILDEFTYSLKNKTLYFNGEYTATLVRDTNCPYSYSEYLKFDNGWMIFNANTTNEAGKKIIIDDIPAIGLRGEEVVVTENLKVRERPSISSKTLKFNASNYPLNWDIKLNTTSDIDIFGSTLYPYIPKHYIIIVHARTEKKYKVSSWNNYWYYIYFYSGDEEKYNYNHSSGWIFGEFLKSKH